MFSNVNVDCCKTLGCKNLGVLNSVDYVAQGKNVLCRECGYLFPVISERSLNLYRNIVNHSWRGVIQQCPACGSTSLKKYGYSAQGQRRMYCHHCDKTFISLEHINTTPRRTQLALMIEQGVSLADIRNSLLLNSTGLNRELIKLAREANYKESRQFISAFDISLSTRAFRVKYNGSNNYLYILVTAEEQSGRVVAISTNYSPLAVEQHYQYTSSYEERMPPGTLVHHVQRKELLTMRRETLFDIDYGPAVLHQNDPGMLVKPVLSAYRHFELVRILTHEHTLNVQHYLDQECFILGGCLMANLQDIRHGRCHISFVKERGTVPVCLEAVSRLFLSGGVRNNVWRAFSTRDYSMAVCNLTGSKKINDMKRATLKSASGFINYVERHPFLPSINRMSPANVASTLDYLKHLWNRQLS
ncbi:IS1/IS1595 family N-terminal zinc-binding domain-containing protein [Escherichia albertii]|uniref:IS1/IS1595 family N-terminal zinc-binding domain-containing protein n=1 Tax=Escherichia albertii TaxID=208962 RepID=UPI0011F37802|nr:cytoplasmic protein [Escherichia albertii]